MSSSQFDSEADRDFKALGFQPGESVQRFDPTPSVTKEALKASLLDSTYDEPVVLSIKVDTDIALKVVVDLVKPCFQAHIIRNEDSPLGCWQLPDVYFEGWLLKSGFDPYREVVRVRAILQTQSIDGSFSDGYIQRIPVNPDPDGPLTFV